MQALRHPTVLSLASLFWISIESSDPRFMNQESHGLNEATIQLWIKERGYGLNAMVTDLRPYERIQSIFPEK